MAYGAGNAIVLERVPEENLSNVAAIRNMMSQMASTLSVRTVHAPPTPAVLN
jgi:hypothetical protein